MQRIDIAMEEKRRRRLPKFKLNLNYKIKLPGRKRERYVFTDKKHPEKGIMSSALGALSLFTIFYSVYLSFLNGGQAQPKYAAAVIFCLIYSVAGLILGIISRTERDIFLFFPKLGIFLNALSIIGTGTLLVLAFM